MSAPAKLNFKIYQGATFAEVLRWESAVKVYVPITGITKSAPLVVTAPAHGVPVEWRVKFTNIAGMTDLNSDSTYHQVYSATTDNITINSVNSLGFKAYTAGGIVEYNKPVDTADYTARMQIRSKLDSPDIILSLTTENSGIVIDNIKKTITLNISAVDTAALTFNTAVYGLEMISSGGQVTPFVVGNLTLVKEVTR
jgi:hypothetical protein